MMENTGFGKDSVLHHEIDGPGRLLNLVHKELEMGVVRYQFAKAALTGTLPPQGLRRQPIT